MSRENTMVQKSEKKNKGQFYTILSTYILNDLPPPPTHARCVIEPFAGQGDLLQWLEQLNCWTGPIESYDIDPKKDGIIKRDTLLNPPNYENAWIITNPPYLARNKCDNKQLFDKFDTNDLYKCFITSLTQGSDCVGGIFIIPVGFFLSPRDIDVRCRNAFLSKYKLTHVNYFEEDVFPDTSTTVVAFSFEKSDNILTEQTVEWTIYPTKQTRRFQLSAANNWIIGGDIYNLPVPANIHIKRYVEGMPIKDQYELTELTLNALDSGKMDGRICLKYIPGYTYPGKNTSRSYATLCIKGQRLSAEQQHTIAEQFNHFVENKRDETWSLFLPQFRESKEYARKRIPFDLAYSIVLYLIAQFQ